jgi:hypothetical protein
MNGVVSIGEHPLCRDEGASYTWICYARLRQAGGNDE